MGRAGWSVPFFQQLPGSCFPRSQSHGAVWALYDSWARGKRRLDRYLQSSLDRARLLTRGLKKMRVLVSDDQQDVLEAIRLLLKGAGHQAEVVDSPRAALAAVER